MDGWRFPFNNLPVDPVTGVTDALRALPELPIARESGDPVIAARRPPVPPAVREPVAQPLRHHAVPPLPVALPPFPVALR